ncbi:MULTISPECIES: Tn3 family transposase [Azonexaceae]|jgi:TnpA family transposase|uniref:Tn3 family transposase n=1 Tax=Azonexaceae TaxID=2008795 RepID=UPI001291AB01|nr:MULTISPECIES: Tn3 family transposase [Azonexaceae]MBX9799981.1 Tn3 family transposase [Burkholderiaceae bacterium]MDO9453338.1 Tn3 family transposase [Stagnimonas sp.]MDP3419496.1 Tn3 family transposase [Thiobacillus sp.]MDZ4316616.1 Tn3 family transposase [Azonexus sp.]MCB4361986.1 Tn3 family transposase [Quatrionicoccus australiensis]
MPRRSLLTTVQQEALFAFPGSDVEIARYYTFDERDLSIIRQRRGAHNRIGFAVQLCYLRYPGYAMAADTTPPDALLSHVSRQLRINPAAWAEYAQRDETRREHALELQAAFGYRPFSTGEYRKQRGTLTELALQTNKGMVIAEQLIEILRKHHIILPPAGVIDRLCAEALARGTRLFYQRLTDELDATHRKQLDKLLTPRDDVRTIVLTWLRQPPGEAKARRILLHLGRLDAIREVGLPVGLDKMVHQGRLTQLAREGTQMSIQHLRDLEATRRHATLVAMLIDTQATVIDQILDLNDRIIGKMFSDAKRKHAESFHNKGKAINDKVRLYSRVGHALIDARKTGTNPFTAIEAVIPWETFTQSITEAEKLAQPESFDHLHLIEEGYSQVRRYSPRLLEAFAFKAAPVAQKVLDGIDTIKAMNAANARSMPKDAPVEFIKPRWEQYVVKDDGIDRRFYELCALSELKNALRSGDVWVPGSRQFKDFEEYLLPPNRFAALRNAGDLSLAIDTDGERYLQDRLALLKEKLVEVNRLAAAGELPDAEIANELLKIKPLTKSVPEEAERLEEHIFGVMPRPKITELLLEVDQWTDFTRHFTHLRTDALPKDRSALLTVILADAINLGLTKMAEACPGTTFNKLDTVRAWHVRDESYSKGLAELVNYQHRLPFASHWGTGKTSSSDGQNYKVGGRGGQTGQVNLRYGSDPGINFYTHISDQYAPYHIKAITSTIRDATHVLDGLLYHESELNIEEHYTDTNGFTDHIFALCPPLGFRFAPRIRDLKDKNLFVPDDPKNYPALANFLGEKINQKIILTQWQEYLRLVTSIKQGTVTASLMLRKLASYPRQNGLALALREIGRIERTIFALDWLLDPRLRQRVTAGLNKGEAKNTLARAVCFNRLGEIRDRTYELQRHRASGLNLVVAAIILWNTVYLERAVNAMRAQEYPIDEALLKHVAPIHWNHINLTGDYAWKQHRRVEKGGFRPLLPIPKA